jgi:hypothetical protein
MLGRASFLKKRSKKLLDDLAAAFPVRLRPDRKSFLVLFFKKEPLPPTLAFPFESFHLCKPKMRSRSEQGLGFLFPKDNVPA